MASDNGYGKAPWVIALVVSVLVTFFGTLLFAQSVWTHNQQNATVAAAGTAASQPASQPAGDAAADRPAWVGTYDGTAEVDHSALDAILADHVRDERIDYAAIKNGPDAAKLDGYLDQMAQVDVAALSQAEQLAYWINLYNAGMIEAVLEAYPIDNVEHDLGFDVFKRKFIETEQGTLSLDDVEHGVIREQFADEPRIHAALVCGAISCPPLLPRAYRAEDLDETLGQKVQAWIDGPRNEVDHESQTLRLSGILKWYAADFGGEPGVIRFVNNLTDRDVSDYAVEYKTYDWTLNDTQ